MFGETTKTLIVVYTDEIALNQLRKMIETKDDNGDEIIGIKDGSVKIVSWSEKVWRDNKKAGNISNKILFLGEVKGVKNLIPVLDVKYDKFGVRYGWAGSQAIVYVDPKALSTHEKYNAFLKELADLPMPGIIKNANPKLLSKLKEDPENDDENVSGDARSTEDKAKQKGLIPGIIDNIQDGFEAVGNVAEKAGKGAAFFAQDLFRDKGMVKQQMLFYGVYKLYYNHLEEFMNS